MNICSSVTKMIPSKMWPLLRTQYDVRGACAAENLEYSAEKVFLGPNELFEIELAEVILKGKASTY